MAWPKRLADFCIALEASGFFANSRASPASANAQYIAIKSAIFETESKAKFPAWYVSGFPLDDPTLAFDVGVDDCGSYEDALGTLGTKDGPRRTFALLAVRVLEIEKRLKTTHIPQDKLTPLVAKFETNLINVASKETETEKKTPYRKKSNFDKEFDRTAVSLVAQLEQIRKAAGVKRPRIIAHRGECGAGDVDVTLLTEPPGGQIFVIPTFFFLACEREGKDPYDRNSCRDCTEANRPHIPLSGRYNYTLCEAMASGRFGQYYRAQTFDFLR